MQSQAHGTLLTLALDICSLSHDVGRLPRHIAAHAIRSDDRVGDLTDRGYEATDRDRRAERGERTQPVLRVSIDRLRGVGVSSSIAPERRGENRGTDHQLLK
jgi:hypothetical protein